VQYGILRPHKPADSSVLAEVNEALFPQKVSTEPVKLKGVEILESLEPKGIDRLKIPDAAKVYPKLPEPVAHPDGTVTFYGRTQDGKLVTVKVQSKILGKFQAERAKKKYDALSSKDRKIFDDLLSKAQSWREELYLRKALAAGHPISAIETFASEIRGKSAEWMQQNLRLVDDSKVGGKGIKQQWDDSCVPTTMQALKGEMDPIYALQVNKQNADINKDAPIPTLTMQDQTPVINMNNHWMAKEQKDILEANGGIAVRRGQSGGYGMWIKDALNQYVKGLGLEYTKLDGQNSTSRAKAMKAMDEALAKGIPVPLAVTDSAAQGGHAVLVTGVREGPPKEYLIHDPWEGKTVAVKASDLAAGKIIPSIAGWTKLWFVYPPAKS
jgi:hypothetical protein